VALVDQLLLDLLQVHVFSDGAIDGLELDVEETILQNECDQVGDLLLSESLGVAEDEDVDGVEQADEGVVLGDAVFVLIRLVALQLHHQSKQELPRIKDLLGS
jgi:hypothetical protein